MGGVIIGILAVTVIAIVPISRAQRHLSMCRLRSPLFLQMDPAGLQVGAVTVVFAFLFVDLFDNTGTLDRLAHRGGASCGPTAPYPA